jgi:SAM-dependent methyltransferase
MPNTIKAASRDQWLATEVGRYIYSRQEKLIMDLVSPVAGESLLDVGCGTGDNLYLFQKRKCILTGIDSSKDALELARQKVGRQCEFVLGEATDLPFSDNEFDIVTLITSIQISHDHQKVIAEAIRVCRNRIFVGFLNKHTLIGTKQSVRKLFGFPILSQVRFFSIGEMKSIINQAMNTSITWGSVIYLPTSIYKWCSEFEELLPMKKNPLGAFVGMAVPVRYSYRTVQNPLMNSFELDAKTQAATPDAIRNMLREGD